MSFSVENKSLPPIANILSIKTQTFDDFSFREPVVRIKLIFFPTFNTFVLSQQDICDDKHQQKTYIVWPLCVLRNVTSGN